MERLWTPWRMSYITAEGGPGSAGPAGTGGCFLCAIAADTAGAGDAANHVLYRGRLGVVLLNRYPYNSGHVMVAPYTHVADLTQLPAEVGHELFDLTQLVLAALQAEYRPDGYNVGLNLGTSAGAGLPGHLHLHAVPRWSGDTNFMPVLAGAKVIPQSLDCLWELLAEAETASEPTANRP